MKKLLIVTAIFFLAGCGLARAYNSPATAQNADHSRIVFLKKAPERPYRVVGPVEVEGLLTRGRFKEGLREEAATMGAHAIMDFDIKTRVQESSCAYESVPWAKGKAVTFSGNRRPKINEEEIAAIKIMRTIPDRSFQEIGPVEVKGVMAKLDFRRELREKAAPMGAEAVIGVYFGTEDEAYSCVTESVPVATGTAIVFLPAPGTETVAAKRK